jgi:Zn-dependent peptidase ImmA (M78 family)
MTTFDISLYRENDLERWISEKYQAAGIYNASDLEIERLAAIYDIEVRTYRGPSFAEWQEGEYSFLFLNNQLSLEEMREHFFHELCHPLRHVGRQDDPHMSPLFRQLQETQAEAFQLYASMPAYLLEEFTPYARQSNFLRILAESFALPFRLVERRIRQILGRINQTRSETQHMRTLHTPDTTLSCDRDVEIDDRTIVVMQDNQPAYLLFKVYREDWDATLRINTQQLLNQPSFYLHGLDVPSLPIPAAAFVQDETDTVGVHMPTVSRITNLNDVDIDFLHIRIADLEYVLQRVVRIQYDW